MSMPIFTAAPTRRCPRRRVDRFAAADQGRQLATAGGTAHRELVDVGERGELVHQRVTGEERTLPKVRELRPGPPAGNKVARGVGVPPSLAAHGEVQECPSLRRRLAHVTSRA